MSTSSEEPPRRKRKNLNDAGLVFRVANGFFSQKKSAKELADELDISRQRIYDLLVEARDRRIVRLDPPIEPALAEKIAERYPCNPRDLHVVNVSGESMVEHVATAAAIRAIALIRELGQKGHNPVGLGLGPGGAGLDFCRALAERLPNEPGLPKLKLFAITAGSLARSPQLASVSFFNLFPKDFIDSCVGLFAENLVPAKHMKGAKGIISHVGMREAFEERHQIHIVVTGMGDFEDEHDLLALFLKDSDVDVKKLLHEEGWIGNVQYRPFTKTGPVIEKPDQLRAATLFELEDFVQLANKKDGHVILIARPCARCGRTRATALRTLLTVKELKVWSEIVMDMKTARELLAK